MTSEQQEILKVPEHIAIIMDGNGRWAKQRGLPRLAGHRAGTENIRKILIECVNLGVRYLTLYAFSTENWKRPRLEVNGLMNILSEFIDSQLRELHAEQVQLRHVGRIESLSSVLQHKIREAVSLTQDNTRLILTVALNYGGRADIVDAVRSIIAHGVPPEAINEQCLTEHLSTHPVPDPDLIIRTSGEWRLSNFLVWEAAYSEYWTTPTYWPDFGPDQLKQAIRDYGRRKRRFGGLSED
ncbi:MAG: isoprenyl transferase [Chloroflexi bacterium AL-N1]|nr:isoprenyl transferase [Chloroflexi bacterium AL-N1]NOK77302.1 isoprenyl transferase [Chloroflexi bacterium AL-N5]